MTGADYRGHAARVHNWLLRHLIGPFFQWRLRFLNLRERPRLARAEKSGDVYRAAWLIAHYRNERGRRSRHRS